MTNTSGNVKTLKLEVVFFFSVFISNNFSYKAQLILTLLTMQVTTILTKQYSRYLQYDGNNILNTVLTESTITFITSHLRY